MCKIEGNRRKLNESTVMELKTFGESKVDKLKSSMVSSGSRIRPWLIRLTTTVLLWTCIVQLVSLMEFWGPGVLKGWPSCFSHESAAAVVSGVEENALSVPPKIVFLPKREFLLVLFYPFEVFFLWKIWLLLLSLKKWESLKMICQFLILLQGTRIDLLIGFSLLSLKLFLRFYFLP